jgi:DNA-binding response OmpR family regulator
MEHLHTEKLEEIDKLKSRFFANISHEFRTPLTLILGPAEKINRESSGEEIEKQATVIKRNASRLLSLINQLLDLSKLEAGKMKLRTTKTNLVTFTKGITMAFESVAELQDITLKVKADKDIIEIYIDRDKLTKIMTNLLSNAFKFTPEGGRITVTVTQNDLSFAEIRIKDTGFGIPAKEQSKLFDRFYQVDSSFTKEHEGTGIGLALTKELVEFHHGTIRVSSKPGEGAEFTVQLPLGRGHLKDMEIIDQAEIENDVVHDDVEHQSEITLNNDSTLISGKDSEKGEDKNILLIVEDNADVREFIKDSLGNNFQLEEAANGEQGIEKAQKIIPDIIISDVMMPKINGYELTRILKNDERTNHIPIILLTAKSGQESRLDGLVIGADDYLTKPFDTNELKIRIKNLLDIRKKLQEKYSKGVLLPRKGKKKISDLDDQFMNNVLAVINKHIAEEEFSIEAFDQELGLGRVQIFRKLKALTGKSPSRYIRSIRLNRARQKIEEKRGNISEIAYSVGFSSPAYFSKCFKEEFGFLPSSLPN